MRTKKNSTIVGVFQDDKQVEAAVRALHQAGFREEQISVIRRHLDEDHDGTEETSHAGAGAATGAAAGAGIAALWSLGVTFGVLPVIGPILAAGPIAAALISAAGGAAAGGLVGALVGMGIPKEDAAYYEGELQAGRFLVIVRANGRSDEAWSILEEHGAYSRPTNRDGAICETKTTTKGKRAGSQRTVKVHEEELHAQKTPVQTGEVRVRKEVRTERQNIQVPVEREEVVIERRPASGRASASDLQPGEQVRIPVREEKVRVEKENVVKEEVVIGKRKVTGTQQVQGKVRKEHVKVEKKGNVKVREQAGAAENC